MMNEVCGVCDKPKEEHGASNHEFSVEGVLTARKPEQKMAPPVKVATDFVLRLLLIEKGLISSDDISGMEAKVRGQLQQDWGSTKDRADAGDLEGDHSDRVPEVTS